MTNKNMNYLIKNHPRLQEIYKLLKDCDFIKYAAYRIGAKIHILQKNLYMEEVRLGIVAGVFERHGYTNLENLLTISISELESIIYDIFFAAEKERQKNINVDTATDLMLLFILNLLLSKPNERISIFTVKIILIVLSESKLQAKFHYFYEQIADSNNYISRNNFTLLIDNLEKLPQILSNNSIVRPINSVVDSFFQRCPSPFGASEHEYFQWLRQEPQIIGWLCALHRIQAALNVNHNFKCAACRAFPIRGLRYRCLRCFAYDQCQNCFFTGRYTRGHKSSHPMQEYCYQTSSKENTLNFFKVLINKISKSSPRAAVSTGKYSPENNDVPSPLNLSSLEVMPLRENAATFPIGHSPPSELQSIISHLDSENKHLHNTIEQLLTRCNDLEMIERCLKEHRSRVQAQIRRLHLLKNHLADSSRKRVPRPESTPMMKNDQVFNHLRPIYDLSPIPKVPDQSHTWKLSPRKLETIYDQSSLSRSRIRERDALTISTDSEFSYCLMRSIPQRRSQKSGFNTWLEEAGVARNPSVHNSNALQFNELDQALERLHEMLNSNFKDQDPMMDNDQLQKAANEMENLLTNLIDTIQINKTTQTKDSIL